MSKTVLSKEPTSKMTKKLDILVEYSLLAIHIASKHCKVVLSDIYSVKIGRHTKMKKTFIDSQGEINS